MLLTVLWQGIAIFVVSTFVFDVIHFLLHKMEQSQILWVSKMGRLHQIHHQFFDEKLKTHPELWQANLKYHLIPELVTQIIVTSLFIIWANSYAVLAVVLFEILIFFYVLSKKGFDFNHTYNEKAAKRPSMSWFILPNYHYQHHIDPTNFYGSWYRFFDFIFGYSSSINQKTFLITGSSGTFGREIKQIFLKKGIRFVEIKYGIDFTQNSYDEFVSKIQGVDGLILCHGSKEDCQWSMVESYKKLITLFLEHVETDLPEIWALGSEIEFHPAVFKRDIPYEKAKREYAKFAIELYQNKNILYRHIVSAAFKSSFNPAPFGAKAFAWLAVFFAKRGFRYIPLTYTGIAYLNYFKFRRL